MSNIIRFLLKYTKSAIFFFFLIAIFFSFFVWKMAEEYYQTLSQAKFNDLVDENVKKINNRFMRYGDILTAGVSFIDASDNVTREDWHKFIAGLNIEVNYPAMQGFGFTIMLKPDEVAPMEHKMRAEGYAAFSLKPPGIRKSYSTILYLEPENARNQAAIGYDMYSNPIRKTAMNIARDTGKPALSGKVVLVQEIDKNKQAGVLLYAPLYKKNIDMHSLQERQKGLIGFIHAPFRMQDFIDKTNAYSDNIDLKIYDSRGMSDESLLGNSSKNSSYVSNYTVKRSLTLYNHTWTILFSSSPQFDASNNTKSALLVTAGLLSIYFILLAIIFTLLKSRYLLLEQSDKINVTQKELKSALDELKEQKYALDAHSIVAITDVKGTITFVNSKFEEISGYTSEELIGKNHRLLNSGVHGIEFWKEMYHTVSHGKIWNGEVCNIAKNGSHYWVDTTIVPFLDENKKPVSYIAIRTDITDRKTIQDSLNAAMQLQKAIFENAGLAIITTDTEGMITAFNSAGEEMLGYKSQELVGKQSPAVFHKLEEVVQRAQELSQELGEVVEPGFKVFVIKTDKGLPNSHEWTYVHKDGHEIPAYLSVTALYDSEGNTSGYMGMASDVSLFKEAEHQMLVAKEAAEASVRIKSEFLATMSHEIRTPMNGVLGMLGLLSHSKLDETQHHQIRVASNSANSLLGLINDILDFSKVEAGKMEIELIEFNLRDELGEFVEAIAFKAQEKGLELILDTTQLTRSTVICDPGRLRQILTNLIGNAVKFTHRGEVLVRVMLDEVDAHNGRLRIDVRDSGIGIAPDKIDTLFESFSQADNSTTRKYGGTGLGLAIVKKLCELMDGRIWITSVEYEGSTFHIDIGVGLGEVSALSIPRVSVADKTVLVVDDNETNRAVVRAQLETWGMEVYEAEDPIIAFDYCQIRIAKGHVPPYDVALLDMQMPNMDGADLGVEIRNLRECDDMKMIMMTSLGSRNDAQRFAQIGFDAFFAKPTTTKDLLNALKVLFEEGEAMEGATPLITKDYLGTLQENIQIQWPSDVRILLVEDNPTNQMVAQGILEMIGLRADVASNGLEGLEAMQVALGTAPYTLILMDCQMPEMDGYAASTAIREGKAGEAYTKIPIIAMTANAMAGDREKCLISGMSDYVTKPINLDVLRAVLLKWLEATVIADESNIHTRQPKAQIHDKEAQSYKLWDEADALKRLGGKKELLIKIMQSFVDESHRMTSALNTAIAQGDLPNIQLHAHSIKGSAANVSAQQLQALAKTMEFAAKNGNKSTLKREFVNLEKAMQEVCAVFEKVLHQEARPVTRKKRMDSLEMAIKLQNLKKEIEAGAYIDTDTLDIFGDYADEEFTARINVLKGHIDRFDVPEALALLKTIMAGLE